MITADELVEGIAQGREIDLKHRKIAADTCRQALLRFLEGDQCGVRLHLKNAVVNDRLDLSDLSVTIALVIESSKLSDIDFSNASFQRVAVIDCRFESLKATNIQVANELDLSKSTALGEVDLEGARVGGNLTLTRASFLHGLRVAQMPQIVLFAL